MSEKLLEINDLEIIYKTDLETVRAVNGLTFSINKGESLGLVGETGAGKTTASLAILQLLPERTGHITKGTISFLGKDLLKASEKEMREIRGSKISMIFQDPMTALNPIFNVGDQISEALVLHNHDNMSHVDIQNRVDEVLELVGIPKTRKKDFPHQFSGGMKQRVIIAIALACEPELLIADEPTTALDVTIQAQVLAMINDLQKRLKTSMIMITHDLGIVAQVCDHVAVMYAGQIIERGTATHIFTAKHHHPYTVGLFGSIPSLDEECERLSPIDGLMPDPTRLPEGCKFSPRCPRCMEKCLQIEPQEQNIDGHMIRCHLYSEENGGASNG